MDLNELIAFTSVILLRYAYLNRRRVQLYCTAHSALKPHWSF